MRKKFPAFPNRAEGKGREKKIFKKGVQKMRKEENKPEAPERKITMGSLFDGIGGFPLAAVRNGIEPVWASEIEAFPIAVTRLKSSQLYHP